MTIITESQARSAASGGVLRLRAGERLSPAAETYVREHHIVLRREGEDEGGRYVELATGRTMAEKPEELTQLDGNRLVPKDHPRIRFRGQMDLLQGEIVCVQAELAERGVAQKWIDDLQDVLDYLRLLTRSEVLDVPVERKTLLGLTPQELRAQSHDPKGYFGVEFMALPHYAMGLPYARFNALRAQSRVLEEAGVAAFREDATPAQREVLQALNRLSSALHILMCRWLMEHSGR